MAEEIERREYYEERERKNAELVNCMSYAAIWLIIAGLLSIALKNLIDKFLAHFALFS